jgi:hypothetical protein
MATDRVDVSLAFYEFKFLDSNLFFVLQILHEHRKRALAMSRPINITPVCLNSSSE